jgi:DNA-binding CsgD family transcriptional regulator
MSSIKILLRDQQGIPLLSITTSIPVDPNQHVTAKVSRLLDENQFLRSHYHTFARLGRREKEILKWLALGKNAGEIAALLFIAPTTVETHRRNIKRKLNVSSIYEMIEFARAFDLV